jgi:hypothetical protein
MIHEIPPETTMHDRTRTNDTLPNAEIKALLILLLLKSGTPSREIQTALRLAQDETMGSDPNTSSHLSAKPQSRSVSPRQRIRNDYLAPIRRLA